MQLIKKLLVAMAFCLSFFILFQVMVVYAEPLEMPIETQLDAINTDELRELLEAEDADESSVEVMLALLSLIEVLATMQPSPPPIGPPPDAEPWPSTQSQPIQPVIQPAHAPDLVPAGFAPPSIEVELLYDGELLTITATQGSEPINAIFINNMRFAYVENSPITIETARFIALGEDITIYAIDENGNASNMVIIEVPRIAGSITPDGQGQVLDHLTGAEDNIELLTITTPHGSVFFLVIDHSREQNNVYFLNAVSEWDLMYLAGVVELPPPPGFILPSQRPTANQQHHQPIWPPQPHEYGYYGDTPIGELPINQEEIQAEDEGGGIHPMLMNLILFLGISALGFVGFKLLVAKKKKAKALAKLNEGDDMHEILDDIPLNDEDDEDDEDSEDESDLNDPADEDEDEDEED